MRDERALDGPRIGLDVVHLHQRQVLALQLERRVRAVRPAAARTRSDISFGISLAATEITPRAPSATRASAVASSPAKTAKSSGQRRHEAGDLAEVRGRLLQPRHARDLGQAPDRLDVEVHGGATRLVAHEDRQIGRVGDRGEVPHEAVRARAVVHRRDRKDAVGLGRRGVARPEDGARGVVAARAGHDGHPAVRRAHDGGRDGLALVARESRRLARRAAGHEEVHALRDLPVHERLERSEVDPAAARRTASRAPCRSPSSPLALPLPFTRTSSKSRFRSAQPYNRTAPRIEQGKI